jgi:hypothetical protein
LTGPKRGLALISNNYIETDLRIKDNQGEDRRLSKGYLTIRCASRRPLEKCVVESVSLATRLSTVEAMYGFLPYAVEGTIAIEVVQGYFDGGWQWYRSNQTYATCYVGLFEVRYARDYCHDS